MNKIRISKPANCQCCGSEAHDYQLKMAKIGGKVLDICPKCNEIYTSYVEAASLLKNSQETSAAPDPQLMGPTVQIEPMQPVLQKAVDILKRMDPNYFVGIKKVKAGVSSFFGFVESGPSKDPTIININLGMISQKAKEYGTSATFAAAIVIAHECGHVKSFNEQQGFVGGEGPAQIEEKRVANWIEQNKDRLKDLDVAG